MKSLLLIAFFLLSLPTYGQGGRLLKCLGTEEKRFHLKKEKGPVYELNQKLMGELIQVPNVDVSDEDYRLICDRKNFSESWKLLELSIKKGKSFFVISKTAQGMQQAITVGMIDDYVETTKDTFLAFIAQIQAESPTPTCLKEEIPELDSFFTEIKYLQEDVDMADIFRGKDQKIFDKLKGYPQAFDKCRKNLKKKKVR